MMELQFPGDLTAQGWALDGSDPVLVNQLAKCRALVTAVAALPLPPRDQIWFRERNREEIAPALLDLGEIVPALPATAAPPGRQADSRSRGRTDPPPTPVSAHQGLEAAIFDLWEAGVGLIQERGVALIDENYLQYLVREFAGLARVPADDGSGSGLVKLQGERERLYRWLRTLPATTHPIAAATAAHAAVLRFGSPHWPALLGVWIEGLVLLHFGAATRTAIPRPSCTLAPYYVAHGDPFQQARLRAANQQDLAPLARHCATGLAERLAALVGQVSLIVQATAFRDMARGWLERQPQIGSRHRDRMLQCLYAVLDASKGTDSPGLPIQALKSRQHPLVQAYRRLGETALARDLRFLQQCQLVVRQGQFLRANLGLMAQFTLATPLNTPPASKA